jgi:hypothetical protein
MVRNKKGNILDRKKKLEIFHQWTFYKMKRKRKGG